MLFPPLLFTSLATADFGALTAGELALAMVAGAGAMMLTLSLLRPVLGVAGLDFAAVRRGGRALPLAVVLKLAVLPAFVFAALQALGVSGLGATVALLIAGLPTAPSSYILARQLGGDAQLLAGIIAVQTALSMLTLPLLLGLLT